MAAKRDPLDTAPEGFIRGVRGWAVRRPDRQRRRLKGLEAENSVLRSALNELEERLAALEERTKRSKK